MMRKFFSRLITRGPLAVLASLALLTVAVSAPTGCGSGAKEAPGHGGGNGNAEGGLGADGSLGITDGGLYLGDGYVPDAGLGLDVEPTALQTLTVTMGQAPPRVAYAATLNGQPANATWTVDRGDLGSVGSPGPMESFTPSGTTGGLVTLHVTAGGITVQRQVFIKLSGTQNGAGSDPANMAQIVTNVAQLGAGGGVGGVGGEGLGTTVVNMPTLAALKNPAQNGQAQGLKLLYPYDQTVWPRSMLAPLLQWTWNPVDGGVQDADAIQIALTTTSGSFSWTGTFGPPAILAQSGGTFIRHPIPESVWTAATNTAGGPTPSGAIDKLQVSLVVAKAGQGYGPITETWIVAPGRLEGTVYYNSYGTALVKNSNFSVNTASGNQQVGAAVLGIKSGATSPVVVAGTPSDQSGSGCRVCHVVASGGGRLIAQHGDSYGTTSFYDLNNGNAETVLNGMYNGTFGWAGLSPDGTLALTNGADMASGTPNSALYPFPPTSTTPLPVTGIPSNLQAGTPVFSPDGKHVAFGFVGGTIGSTAGNDTMLAEMDFAPPGTGDAGAEAGTPAAFSNLKILATLPAGHKAGFPTFFPTNDAVAFHYQVRDANGGNHEYDTWHQAEAQVWWSDLASSTATELFTLNGHNAGGTTSYLPTSSLHPDDTVLNYEPTVSPVSSGGYMWVIFTSRRLYGNLATGDPWLSDPRDYDYTIYANATTKKLWVAAIDLNAKPGTDPSHPAFYLPAQELLAGNSRGFWVVSPCLADTMGCTAGDQCCGGYCRSVEGQDAGLSCTSAPPVSSCSNTGDKCVTAASCCDTYDSCINGFCAIPTPQ